MSTLILYIYNEPTYHYEIIESVIVNYNKIINIPIHNNIQIYLVISENKSFESYILTKFPTIRFEQPADYDYYINCTIYDIDYDTIIKNSNKSFYIGHTLTERLDTLSNVYFLTPLAKRYINANILPFSDIKIKTEVPVYIIQGKLHRRDLKLLHKILSVEHKYKFKIVLLTRSKMLRELIPYKEKIELKHDLNYIDFHKEFQSAYCILPLITKTTHPHYYTTKLTSSINYASGYNLTCLIDKDLQDIYKLNKAEVYNDISDIIPAFCKTLYQFYI